VHTLSPASNTSNGRFGLAAVQVQSTGGTPASPAEALKLSTLQAILCVSAGGHISRQQGILFNDDATAMLLLCALACRGRLLWASVRCYEFLVVITQPLTAPASGTTSMLWTWEVRNSRPISAMCSLALTSSAVRPVAPSSTAT
jgi:hypothetical protein